MAALLLSLIMTISHAAGFKNGNTLRVAAIEGRVTVFCPGIGERTPRFILAEIVSWSLLPTTILWVPC